MKELIARLTEAPDLHQPEAWETSFTFGSMWALVHTLCALLAILRRYETMRALNYLWFPVGRFGFSRALAPLFSPELR
jgi:hypothetical protein